MKPDILLYTTSWCPFCRRAKALLTEKGVQWIKASGRSTVPQIFINGTHVGGSDDLARLDADGELDKLLAGGAPAN